MFTNAFMVTKGPVSIEVNGAHSSSVEKLVQLGVLAALQGGAITASTAGASLLQ